MKVSELAVHWWCVLEPNSVSRGLVVVLLVYSQAYPFTMVWDGPHPEESLDAACIRPVLPWGSEVFRQKANVCLHGAVADKL